jgi:hypothetical protein
VHVFVSEYTRHGWDRAFFSSQRRDSRMLWDTCVNVSACLANIQCATALTRELIHNMWSQGNGYPVFKWKETRKHIISEHTGVSPLTGKERSISTMSSILAHKHMHKHPVSASDFKILSSGTSEWDLLIRESLLISQLNHVLNANIRSTPLELF